MAALPELITPRLSLEANAVVRLASDEARDLGGASVCPEHLLLALLRDPESSTARALEGLRLTYERARGILAPQDAPVPPPSTDSPVWSRAVLLVLERADDETTYRGADLIRPEHLLVALDPWEESIARAFADLRPRLRPQDFVSAARQIPGLDEP